jgi:hypothetical protein
MTEHDPAVLDVEQWADYWASLKIDAVMVSVTGILAFYQTKVPYHRKGKFLGSRDFFGDCCCAAKKRGIHVIARMSPDLNWEDAVQAHPEWFQRDAQGNPIHHTEDRRLFRTCMFTTYMTDYMPAIMKRLIRSTTWTATFTNAWPPLGPLPVCHCEQCKNLPPPAPSLTGTSSTSDHLPVEAVRFDCQREEAANFYFANLGGGIRSHGRPGEARRNLRVVPVRQPGPRRRRHADLGLRVARARMQRRAKRQNVHQRDGGVVHGHTALAQRLQIPQEEQMWFNETLASGMVPYHHIIGGENGMGEDRRWLEPARKYFDWMAKHDAHFVNKRSIANIGVVMGQRTHLFYRRRAEPSCASTWMACTTPCSKAAFLFDFVHEDKLAPEELAKYSALLLPNTALLSEQQCRQLQAYVNAGRLAACHLRDQPVQRAQRTRPDFGLADVFGIRKAGDAVGTVGNAYLARIEKQHEILNGFAGTNWIPGRKIASPSLPSIARF